ncbi:Tyrosine-protein kinase [Parasponia andersonii]|uniref:Tyrosine-protein kinase n=1 Tax=Parasponia andersonii TaxID=3476 RepID=A0A2P5BYD9_PARAD|nr:Tyrosine-protein kinase [Parasponia andersonii]
MGFLPFLVYFSLLLAFSSLSPVYGNAELEALMELKASLDPDNRFLRSWTEEGDPCSGLFEGVACNEHRKVANISLQGKGLSGKVSPAVAELKCLSGLYLHYNNLSGEIPREISNLTELNDLYLNVNNLYGTIPSEIGSMASLQVLQLCCNQLTGKLPSEIRFLKRLSVLALQYNRLTGQIPPSLGDLGMLKRLDLSFNRFFGSVPARLSSIQSLEILDVRNNTLSGVVSPGFRRLNEGFKSENNPGLCGVGFSRLRACTAFDNANLNVDGSGPTGQNINDTADPRRNPESANVEVHCNQTHCSKSARFSQAAVVAGVVIVTITMTGMVFVIVIRYRRRKQKISSTCDPSDGRLSTDQGKEFQFHSKNASPLVRLEYCNGWDPLGDGGNGLGSSQEYLNRYRFNMEEIESATQYFSEVNLLGKSKFSSVYKGVLRDGSVVAIRSISITSCKSDEAEFVKGLNLLFSLRHENLVKLRGFCCSKSRSECYLIYDFAPKGTLSRYLDTGEGSDQVLDWSKRVSIISGIAKGIQYLHSSEANRPAMIHQNISAEKVLIDHQFNPLISDSGLPKLLADDIVFSALKTSAAMGYLAPEYITTGRFTEKSDIYAFGVIVLQVVSGQFMLTKSIRMAAKSSKFEDFVDANLKGEFPESEAAKLGELGLACTHELPEERPNVEEVIQDLSMISFSF